MLVRQALAGAESAGADVEYVRLCDYTISPCVECNSCYKTGLCRVEDDYQQLSVKMVEADRLIFGTPVFFMTVCAQAKLLIDRCQCLWAHKYVLKEPLITSSRDRRAMVIAVGGTKGKKMFESIRLTMKYWLDVLDMHYAANLFVNNVDDAGDIQKHPTAMNEAFRLGKDLVTVTTAPPERPIDVELS
jgi:multimeric flavodoxin WrbA